MSVRATLAQIAALKDQRLGLDWQSDEHKALDAQIVELRKTIDITREEAIALHRENITDSMHFTPTSGKCYSCGGDLIEHFGHPIWAEGNNVTGCPLCNRSYCD